MKIFLSFIQSFAVSRSFLIHTQLHQGDDACFDIPFFRHSNITQLEIKIMDFKFLYQKLNADKYKRDEIICFFANISRRLIFNLNNRNLSK